MKKTLTLDSDDGGDEDLQLSINKDFAKKFEERKRKQELAHLREQLSEEESTSEEEDEDGELIDDKLDKEIETTLRLIRKRDPRVYDKRTVFYHDGASESQETEDSSSTTKKKTKKEKPKYYKDVLRENLLAGKEAASEEEDEEDKTQHTASRSLTYQEEQDALKRSFLNSVKEEFESKGEKEEDEEEDGLGGMFKVRTRAATEETAPSTESDGTEELDSDEKFLRDYLKGQKWKEDDVAIPSYSELVQEADDEDDEAAVDAAEEFEREYNFRFEEEGGTEIQSYSRNVGDSLRRKDEKRKQERKERKERKERERKQKELELRRLKNLKMQELEERLRKLQEYAGEDVSGHIPEDFDLDEEWDPEKHEQQMQKIFNDEYYEKEEDKDAVGAEAEEDEAEWGEENYMEGEDENYEGEEAYEGEEGEHREGDEGGEEMDASSMTPAEIKALKQKYLDELYGLDYEDLVAGMPTRFKYRQVDANDYGLTVDELLEADDKELKQYVSLKKLAPYREKEWLVPSTKRRKFKQALRKRQREAPPATSAPETSEKNKKRKNHVQADQKDQENSKKKKRKHQKQEEQQEEGRGEGEAEAETVIESRNEEEKNGSAEKKKRKRKKKKSDKPSIPSSSSISASRLSTYKLKPLS